MGEALKQGKALVLKGVASSDLNQSGVSAEYNYNQSTKQFAARHSITDQSLRKVLCVKGHYYGIVPQRLMNGRLVWPDVQLNADREVIERVLASSERARAAKTLKLTATLLKVKEGLTCPA